MVTDMLHEVIDGKDQEQVQRLVIKEQMTFLQMANNLNMLKESAMAFKFELDRHLSKDMPVYNKAA